MFTLKPEAVSVIIAVVMLGVAVVPSAYVTSIFPPVKSKLSPCSKSVFVGAVIVIPVTPFATVMLKLVVCPS